MIDVLLQLAQESTTSTPAPGEHSAWFESVLRTTLACLAIAMVVTCVRLFRGPALPDRVVALDLLATLVVGAVAVYAIQSQEPVLLHVGIGIAILMFLGTVAFALYLEKGAPR